MELSVYQEDCKEILVAIKIAIIIFYYYYIIY
jgi:hypothetical protein